jgi:arginine utilization regulatory protein
MHENNVEYLKYLKRTYERIMDELDVGLHVVNKDGKTILYNKKMMEMEFMKSEDVLDKDLLEVFMFKKGQQSTLLRALQKTKSKRTLTIKGKK